MIRTVAIVLLGIVLCSCRGFDFGAFDRDLNRLEIGLSRSEVESMMGRPWDKRVEVTAGCRTERWVYSYAAGGVYDVGFQALLGNLILLTFEDGVLVKFADAPKDNEVQWWVIVY